MLNIFILVILVFTVLGIAAWVYDRLKETKVSCLRCGCITKPHNDDFVFRSDKTGKPYLWEGYMTKASYNICNKCFTSLIEHNGTRIKLALLSRLNEAKNKNIKYFDKFLKGVK